MNICWARKRVSRDRDTHCGGREVTKTVYSETECCLDEAS
jgi:hypothetical protein